MAEAEKKRDQTFPQGKIITLSPHLNLEKEEEKDLDLGHCDEHESPLPLTVTSRVLYMLGDIAAGPAYRFTQWLDLVRKRSATYGSSGFPHRLHRLDDMVSSAGERSADPKSPPSKETSEISLWERLGKASIVDIDSSSFSWTMLSSLHHTEHSSSTDHSEEDQSKPLEVTVNSGGVVFFALFSHPSSEDASRKEEAAAVIKFASSRMATQSERLGYEFAKWLGVQIPQARVIHSCNPEWTLIKEATEKAQAKASSEGDEVGLVTCSELLEALELSRCLLLMSYVHGCPLLESMSSFETEEKAERAASALGRILVLDLVIRNEDRLPCRQLRWRGNPANLLLTDRIVSSSTKPPLECSFEEAFDSAIKRCHPRDYRSIQKERRASSVDSRSRLSVSDHRLVSQSSDFSDITESPRSYDTEFMSPMSDSSSMAPEFHIVTIDSVVPRRPPAGKRASDQEIYPRLVELLLNSSQYSSNLLYEITEGGLGSPQAKDGEETPTNVVTPVVREFRNGFRAGLRDLHEFHIFLVTLHQKLDGLLRAFFSMMDKTMCADFERDDFAVPESPSQSFGGGHDHHYPSPSKEQRVVTSDNGFDQSESDLSQRSVPRTPGSENKEGGDAAATSPKSRESWHGRYSRGGESLSSQRLAAKLRDFHKFAKIDAESNKELDQWNETLRNEVMKLCQENGFNTGFFEGSDNNSCTDAYELKVRLEHILERISLITKAANTEKPSMIQENLFIGGGLAARSVYTLQHLGITHILCLCANEIGQSDTQYPDLFNYKNFSITDDEDSKIEGIFQEALDFINHGEETGGKILVHCFEGRSRSATVVLAYLMLRKNLTLLEAWSKLRKVHRRAQPNDGFARILVNIDKKCHGKVSMEWRQRKPTMKVCPVCGKNAGLSSSSLKLHLQKSHKKLSSGSVDSAMNMEIQKALEALQLSSGRGSSVSSSSFQSLSG
ncbi:Dual specificity protein phosphatase PHS1 [Raphanus sativus]|uniref:Dual specificity protein phosphatase PHS1-like isoform X3 n=1 Tax=Raphanus sativus TaxID=3726 RepID=A0A9W3CPW5_RAPSA|nr:dual specificity protein phosphatase PHS1-like isoform X3 [Raphanus sativus]KAJ4871464.1 Dual specificity protein phosphatase PHS1 [Raphanus sativus]